MNMCQHLDSDFLNGFCRKIQARCPQKPHRCEWHKPFKVITLCGSTRFKEDFIRVQRELTLKGYIVITVGLFGHADNEYGNAIMHDMKVMLDHMHRRRIDLSSEIYVINKGGYIGDSTKGEIKYADKMGKKITYMEDESMENNKTITTAASEPGCVFLRMQKCPTIFCDPINDCNSKCYCYIAESSEEGVQVMNNSIDNQTINDPEKALYELWKLLDHIDTLSDMAKSNDKAYRKGVEKTQKLRWDILSDAQVEMLYRKFHPSENVNRVTNKAGVVDGVGQEGV